MDYACKKKQSVIEVEGWGTWGAAVLRPYMTESMVRVR
jgi:hypothetical protein